jgi:hypothetical protein
MDGRVDGFKSGLKDCLQQSRKLLDKLFFNRIGLDMCESASLSVLIQNYLFIRLWKVFLLFKLICDSFTEGFLLSNPIRDSFTYPQLFPLFDLRSAPNLAKFSHFSSILGRFAHYSLFLARSTL